MVLADILPDSNQIVFHDQGRLTMIQGIWVSNLYRCLIPAECTRELEVGQSWLINLKLLEAGCYGSSI